MENNNNTTNTAAEQQNQSQNLGSEKDLKGFLVSIVPSQLMDSIKKVNVFDLPYVEFALTGEYEKFVDKNGKTRSRNIFEVSQAKDREAKAYVTGLCQGFYFKEAGFGLEKEFVRSVDPSFCKCRLSATQLQNLVDNLEKQGGIPQLFVEKERGSCNVVVQKRVPDPEDPSGNKMALVKTADFYIPVLQGGSNEERPEYQVMASASVKGGKLIALLKTCNSVLYFDGKEDENPNNVISFGFSGEDLEYYCFDGKMRFGYGKLSDSGLVPTEDTRLFSIRKKDLASVCRGMRGNYEVSVKLCGFGGIARRLTFAASEYDDSGNSRVVATYDVPLTGEPKPREKTLDAAKMYYENKGGNEINIKFDRDDFLGAMNYLLISGDRKKVLELLAQKDNKLVLQEHVLEGDGNGNVMVDCTSECADNMVRKLMFRADVFQNYLEGLYLKKLVDDEGHDTQEFEKVDITADARMIKFNNVNEGMTLILGLLSEAAAEQELKKNSSAKGGKSSKK